MTTAVSTNSNADTVLVNVEVSRIAERIEVLLCVQKLERNLLVIEAFFNDWSEIELLTADRIVDDCDRLIMDRYLPYLNQIELLHESFFVFVTWCIEVKQCRTRLGGGLFRLFVFYLDKFVIPLLILAFDKFPVIDVTITIFWSDRENVGESFESKHLFLFDVFEFRCQLNVNPGAERSLPSDVIKVKLIFVEGYLRLVRLLCNDCFIVLVLICATG